jgi:hypothetical protein
MYDFRRPFADSDRGRARKRSHRPLSEPGVLRARRKAARTTDWKGVLLFGAPGSEFVPLLDRVYRTGEADTQVSHETSTPTPWSCAVWPALVVDGHIVGLIIQTAETTTSHQQTIAMNETLIIGSVASTRLREKRLRRPFGPMKNCNG